MNMQRYRLLGYESRRQSGYAYKYWIYIVGEWVKEKLFNYIKKNKDIATEYHRAVIKKKNENSKDGTVYV